MDWNRLLSNHRLGLPPAAADGGDASRSGFQRDIDRIVFSTAFRRLQDKTQVFTLTGNDSLRTRLTHSVEVSCVGRSLGGLVGESLRRRGVAAIDPRDVGDVVAAACLAHDIGNPPFGHAGEDAVQAWFDGPGRATLASLTTAEQTDFLRFEGNAQGFRVLTRLQYARNAGGMQLTAATLGAFMKYPRASGVTVTPGAGISGKKHGFFQSETALFEELAHTLGLMQREPGQWQRHPLAFLMEAADDICYCIVDIEDGHRVGLLQFDEARELLAAVAFPEGGDDGARSPPTASDEDDASHIGRLRAKAINRLVFAAADVFDARHDEILAGRFDRELLADTAFTPALQRIRSVSQVRLYQHGHDGGPSVSEQPLDVEQIVFALLEAAVPQALGAGDSKALALPAQFRRGHNVYEQLLSATDFVSGMTDSYALETYRQLSAA